MEVDREKVLGIINKVEFRTIGTKSFHNRLADSILTLFKEQQSEELTKLKAENEELKICHKTLRRQLDIRIEENKELKDGNTFYNLYIQKREENTQLKQENEELRKVKNDLYIHYKERKQENTQLKEKLKEVEGCYKLGWEDGAKAAANDIASRI